MQILKINNKEFLLKKFYFFHTFYNIKQWMRVHHAGKYLGQFDCSKCLRLKQLPALIAAATAEKEQLLLELQRCQRHEETKNSNAININ